MQSVLKHFLDKEYSLDELDKLTGRKDGFFTWTSQIVPVLYDLGLNVKYYSRTALDPFLEGENYIRKHYSDSAEKILKVTDMPIFIDSIKKLKKYNLFEKKILPFENIEKNLLNGYIPMVVINHKTIKGEDGWLGHFVVITGFDKENIFYHESGPFEPTPNKKVSKEMFIKAWNDSSTDNDVVIVYGKR